MAIFKYLERYIFMSLRHSAGGGKPDTSESAFAATLRNRLSNIRGALR